MDVLFYRLMVRALRGTESETADCSPFYILPRFYLDLQLHFTIAEAFHACIRTSHIAHEMKIVWVQIFTPLRIECMVCLYCVIFVNSKFPIIVTRIFRPLPTIGSELFCYQSINNTMADKHHRTMFISHLPKFYKCNLGTLLGR